MQFRLVGRKATLVMWQPILPLLGLSVHAVSPCGGGGRGGDSSQQTFLRKGSSWRSGLLYSRPSTNSHPYTIVTFLADSLYIYPCLNLSKTATFFCPQGGEVQLYTIFD